MTIYYVDPLSGSDGAAGTSFGLAWETTQKAADTAAAGDEVRQCNTATETTAAKIDIDTKVGGVVTPIRFTSYNATGTAAEDGYTIQASASITAVLEFSGVVDYTRWSGVTLDANSNATYVINNTADGADYNSFDRCRMINATSHGLFLRGNLQWIFLECEIASNAGWGIVHSSANRAWIHVYGGSVHDNSSGGWAVNRTDCVADSVLVYGNGGKGIRVDSNGSRFALLRSTLQGNTGSGIELYNATTKNGYRILGNALVGNTDYGIKFQAGDADVALLMDYNHTDGNTNGASDLTLPGANNQTGDPLFASVVDGSEDFTPGSGSPLIGNGINGGNIGAVAHAGGGTQGFPGSRLFG